MKRSAAISILLVGIGLCVLALAPVEQTLMVDVDMTYRSDEEVFSEWEFEDPQTLLQGVSKRQIQSLHEDEGVSSIRVDKRSDTEVSITFWPSDSYRAKLKEYEEERGEDIPFKLPEWYRLDLEVTEVDTHGLTIRHRMFWSGTHVLPDDPETKQQYLQMTVMYTMNQFGYSSDWEVRVPEGYPPAEDGEEGAP